MGDKSSVSSDGQSAIERGAEMRGREKVAVTLLAPGRRWSLTYGSARPLESMAFSPCWVKTHTHTYTHKHMCKHTFIHTHTYKHTPY